MDRRYLDKHGQQWRVRLKVPEEARPVLGKTKLVVPLHTDSLATANRKKHAIVADLQVQIERALAEVRRRNRSQPDPLVTEALEWRTEIEREEAAAPADEEVTDRLGNVIDVIPAPTPVADYLEDRAEEIARSRGSTAAGTFHAIATGRATPITAMLDAWMAERADMKRRQQTDYRRAVSRFAAWLPTANLPGSIEAADRKTAGQYVSVMVAKGTHWKTANKDISALSVYWKWLDKKGYCENIWQGQSLSKRLAKVSAKSAAKRPFTDDEVVTLFSGVPATDPILRDAMYISALSGMRREEIARLTVADCVGGVFRIRDAKTDAGDRDVPIHPELRRLVTHRSKGKAVTSYLLHELRSPKPNAVGDRSDAVGKRFKTLRRRLGVDERSGDARQANVDFHSLRRWFDRTALDAHRKGAKGYDQWVLADVMGHERGSAGLEMTVGVYAGPSPMAARKACVEAVRLPKRCQQWSKRGSANGAAS